MWPWRSDPVRLDARLSPAQAIRPGFLQGVDSRIGRTTPGLSAYTNDRTLRWLAASDRSISDQVSRALLEMKEDRLHVKEGHARWSTYLRLPAASP